MKSSPNFVRYPNTTEKFYYHANRIREYQIRFCLSLIITLALVLLSSQIQDRFTLNELAFAGDKWVLLGLGTIVYVFGGWPFFNGCFKEIAISNIGAMTLAAIAISIAFFYSVAAIITCQSDPVLFEMGIIVTLMLAGQIVEINNITASSKSMHKMHKSLPDSVHLLNKRNEILEVPLQSIKCKDKIVVKPGEQIPADGMVLQGESIVNESVLTGARNLVFKTKGSQVITGTTNISGTITIEAQATGVYSYLSQITRLVENTPFIRSPSQKCAEKAANILTIITISAVFSIFFIWKVVLKQDLVFSLERIIAVLIMVNPNILGLIIPLVMTASTSISASRGILIKSRHAFEAAHKIRSVIFYKTGTLTEGKYGVTDIEVFHPGVNRDELIKYAASVEIRSQHPLAKAIVQFSEETFEATKFSYINGKGVSALVEGRDVKVVTPSYLQENNIHLDSFHSHRLREGGKTVVYVLINDELYGAIFLTDTIRMESRAAIRSLKKMGIKTVMLTGDNRRVAKHIASELHLDQYFAEVPQHEKVYRVKEIQKQGFVTAVTGDSISDATTLAQADIGFAIGAGTDIKTKTADILLVHNNPQDVVKTIEMSIKCRNKINKNLLWAFIYNILAFPLAAGVFHSWGLVINPALATAIMVFISFLILHNSRSLRFSSP